MTASPETAATPGAPDAAATDGPPPLAKNRDFRLLWTGQTVSLVGTEISEVAFPLLAILTLNASAGDLGLINAARTLPALAVTLLAGIAVDRMRRRRAMLMANLLRAGTVGVVILLAWTNGLSIAALCLLGFLLGSFAIVFDLAHQAALPRVVRPDDLPAANSRLETSLNVARIGGPGLAGGLVSVVKAPGALVVDLVSYLVSAVTLGLMRTPDDPPAPRTEKRPPIRTELMSGLRLVFRNRSLRALTLEAAVFNFGIQIFLTLFLLYGTRTAGLSTAQLGLAMTIGSAGGLAGALLMPRIVGRLGLGRTLVRAAVVAGVGPLATVAFTGPGTLVMVMIVLSFFTTLFGVVVASICTAVLRQCLTPNDMMGRAVSAELFLTGGVLPVAALVAGLLGETIGVRGAMLVGALIVPLSLLALLNSPVTRLATPEDALAHQAVSPRENGPGNGPEDESGAGATR
ncbi:MFS transporter [Streptomyces triticirhizae]|uniref:MFS transporter n=1 Tax=Streptomyces triticirhizae TaxID=2483353 RepID=A0A3M2LI73_9ACTN|nr:MFS transporter [Streptomyces triticirhizae]RMI36243.1 MFS transporter [Streptomyces triticirhizae]